LAAPLGGRGLAFGARLLRAVLVLAAALAGLLGRHRRRGDRAAAPLGVPAPGGGPPLLLRLGAARAPIGRVLGLDQLLLGGGTVQVSGLVRRIGGHGPVGFLGITTSQSHAPQATGAAATTGCQVRPRYRRAMQVLIAPDGFGATMRADEAAR